MPQPAGSKEEVTITGLAQGMTYRFLIRTWDEAGNISPISYADATVRSGYALTPRFQTNASDPTSRGCATTAAIGKGVGDVDGDGFDDFLLTGGAECGRVRLYRGGLTYNNVADFDYIGTPTGKIYSAFPLGDYNHDNKTDLDVMQELSASQYRHNYYPGTANLSAWQPSTQLSTAWTGAPSRVGDVNGDGYDDSIMGGSLYRGGISFSLSPTFTCTDLTDTTMVPLGDVNGDGKADLAIGHPATSSSCQAWVKILFGKANMTNTPDLTITPPASEFGEINSGCDYAHQFGRVQSIGDWNGDGYDDVAVPASQSRGVNSRQGKIYIYFGGPSFDTNPDAVIIAPPGGVYLGEIIIPLGDVNGDGYADFTSYIENNFSGSSSWIIFFGRGSGQAEKTFTYNANDPQLFDRVYYYGSGFYDVIDFNCDGKTEIIMKGDRVVTTGTFYLVELTEKDTDMDGVPDLTDPYLDNASVPAVQLQAPAAGGGNMAVGGTLSWTVAGGATAGLTFDVYLGQGDNPSLFVPGLTASSLSLAGTPLADLSRYSWKVVAKDGVGQTSASEVRSFTTAAPPVPTAPAGFGATANDAGNYLSWNVPDDIVKQVVIERRPVITGAAWEVIALLDDRTTSGHLDTSQLQPHQQYEYRIAFRNSTGQSGYSQIVSATTPNHAPELALPEQLIFDAGIDNDLPLPDSDTDGDLIQYKLTKMRKAWPGTALTGMGTACPMSGRRPTALIRSKMTPFSTRTATESGTSTNSWGVPIREPKTS